MEELAEFFNRSRHPHPNLKMFCSSINCTRQIYRVSAPSAFVPSRRFATTVPGLTHMSLEANHTSVASARVSRGRVAARAPATGVHAANVHASLGSSSDDLLIVGPGTCLGISPRASSTDVRRATHDDRSRLTTIYYDSRRLGTAIYTNRQACWARVWLLCGSSLILRPRSSVRPILPTITPSLPRSALRPGWVPRPIPTPTWRSVPRHPDLPITLET